jgi:hypothetical protein
MEPFVTDPGPRFGPSDDEPVIAPAPEELTSDFLQRPFPEPRDPQPDAATVTLDNSEALLTDPIPDEESTASVAADSATELFRAEGLKLQVLGADIRFGLNTRFTYNDNILASATNPESDFVTLVTPTIVVGFGDIQERNRNFLLLEYAPTLQSYATRSDLDTIDQFLNLRANYVLSRSTVSPLFRYVEQTDTDDQLGRRNRRTTLFAGLTTTYALTGKTAIQSGLTATGNASEFGVNNEVYAANLFLLYQLTPRTGLALGGSLGYVAIEGGDYQTFQTINAKFTYEGSAKLTYGFTLGAENRQSTTTVFSQTLVETGNPLVPFAFQLESNRETTNQLTPIFELTLRYQPFAATSINLLAFRRVQASSFQAGEIVNLTGLQLSASQRLIQRVFLEVLARYELNEYDFRQSDDRQDNIVIFQPRLRYAFHDDEYSVSLFYSYRENQSTVQSVSYTNSIFGLEFDLDF